MHGRSLLLVCRSAQQSIHCSSSTGAPLIAIAAPLRHSYLNAPRLLTNLQTVSGVGCCSAVTSARRFASSTAATGSSAFPGSENGSSASASSSEVANVPPDTLSTTTTSSAVLNASHIKTSSAQRPDGADHQRSPRGTTRTGDSALGKTRHGPGSTPPLKYKKKAPWGVQQLRDSWSEDAMSKRDRENMDERIHREYRYHPDEFRRHYIRYTAMLTIPCMLVGMSITYYRITGRPIWKSDPQHLLNLLRVMDTSPRSKLYAYKLEETQELPEHVRRHREAHTAEREYEEKVFRLTHSAFERPNDDALRELELQETLKAAAMAQAAEEGMAEEEAADVATDDK